MQMLLKKLSETKNIRYFLGKKISKVLPSGKVLDSYALLTKIEDGYMHSLGSNQWAKLEYLTVENGNLVYRNPSIGAYIVWKVVG